MTTKITHKYVEQLLKDLAKQPPEKDLEIRDAELKGFALRVRPSAKVKAGYTVSYQMVYARGKRVTIGSASELDASQARAAASKIASDHCHAEVGIGEDPIEKRKRIQADNYLQFLEEHYKPHLRATLRGGVNNEESVKETMANLVNRFPELHKLGLSDITPHIIDRWRQRRVQEGVSKATIKRQLNDLSACLNRAIKWGALDTSPFDKLDKIAVDSSAKVRYLSDTEEASLRAQLDAREARIRLGRESANEWREKRDYDLFPEIGSEFADHLKPAVLLSLNTGMRRGELLKLRWSDVDFTQKNLTVTAETAKDGETRHIPLNDEALDILKRWKKQQDQSKADTKVVSIASRKAESGYVFHGEDGEPFQNLRKSWVLLLEKADIKNFRWHDLRHTFASKLVIAGVDLNTVRELLGHSDYKMTLRYAHLAPRVKQEAVNKLVPVKSAER